MKRRTVAAEQGAGRSSRGLERLLFGLALLYPAAYLFVVASRIAYPFELEWVEGAVLQSVQRLLHGLPLYVRPSLAFVPLNYTPLYFQVSALAARLLREGFLALRLVSFLSSLGCLGLIAWLVWHETRDRGAALLAACLFAATYRAGGAWFDVARADSLHLLLLLAGVVALRMDLGARRAPIVSGILFGLAFLTKQSAVVVVTPVLLHALLTDRRRGAWLGASFVLVAGGTALWLDQTTGGWFRFYVLDVARGHAVDRGLLPLFWTSDVMARLGIAALLAALFFALPRTDRAPGTSSFHAALLAGLVASAWSLRLFRGGYENVLMPAHAGLAIVFGLGWHATSGWLAESPPRTRAALRRFVTLACIVQFALLAYNPLRQIPTRADREAGEQCVDQLRRAPGDVLVPSHDYLAVRAGKAPAFHVMPFMDVVKSGCRPMSTDLWRALDDSLRAHHWSYIVVDNRDLLREEAEMYYEARWPLFDNDSVFWTVTGMRTRPQAVEAPREP